MKSDLWQSFKHITKLDPDKKNTTEIINTAVGSDTDAIMISGTQGITKANVMELYSTLRKETSKPILVEPVHKSSMLYDVDFIYIPIVLNSTKSAWMQGLHLDWFQDLIKMDKDVPWDRIITEGYIILNPDSTVSKVTNAKTDIDQDQIVAYANYAQLIGVDAVYFEYSGSYGNIDYIRHVKKFITESKLFYGGGIKSKTQSLEMLKYANTIFVGNVIYENINAYLDTIP